VSEMRDISEQNTKGDLIMNVGSFFSGIGGLDYGFEKEGFTVKWFIEKDTFCQAVLRKNYPGRPVFPDVNTMDYTTVEAVDITIGGFPCQDISQAGKGEGIKGKRSGLWKAYKEGIRILRPKIAVIENVPMLYKRGLNVVLADLAEMGYDAEWFTLSAQEVGALHVRERLFIIAYSREFRQLYLRFQEHSSKTGESSLSKITPSFITYDWSLRVQRFKQETLSGQSGLSWCKDVRRIEDIKGRPNIPKPLFCGGRDGIPDWMDRIKGCGNAVVPQVGQFIARRIKEVMNVGKD